MSLLDPISKHSKDDALDLADALREYEKKNLPLSCESNPVLLVGVLPPFVHYHIVNLPPHRIKITLEILVGCRVTTFQEQF